MAIKRDTESHMAIGERLRGELRALEQAVTVAMLVMRCLQCGLMENQRFSIYLQSIWIQQQVLACYRSTKMQIYDAYQNCRMDGSSLKRITRLPG